MLPTRVRDSQGPQAARGFLRSTESKKAKETGNIVGCDIVEAQKPSTQGRFKREKELTWSLELTSTQPRPLSRSILKPPLS